MNVVTRSDQTEQLDRAATARMQGKEASINHTGGHSMKWPMLLCVAGVCPLGLAVPLLAQVHQTCLLPAYGRGEEQPLPRTAIPFAALFRESWG